jgi:hypothetical protein
MNPFVYIILFLVLGFFVVFTAASDSNSNDDKGAIGFGGLFIFPSIIFMWDSEYKYWYIAAYLLGFITPIVISIVIPIINDRIKNNEEKIYRESLENSLDDYQQKYTSPPSDESLKNDYIKDRERTIQAMRTNEEINKKLGNRGGYFYGPDLMEKNLKEYKNPSPINHGHINKVKAIYDKLFGGF